MYILLILIGSRLRLVFGASLRIEVYKVFLLRLLLLSFDLSKVGVCVAI